MNLAYLYPFIEEKWLKLDKVVDFDCVAQRERRTGNICHARGSGMLLGIKGEDHMYTLDGYSENWGTCKAETTSSTGFDRYEGHDGYGYGYGYNDRDASSTTKQVYRASFVSFAYAEHLFYILFVYSLRCLSLQFTMTCLKCLFLICSIL